MTGWKITGILAPAILAFVGLGFAAMSTTPPFTVWTWVPYLFFILAGLSFVALISCLICILYKNRKKRTVKLPEEKTPDQKLPEILAAMHERMRFFKAVRAKKKVDKKLFEEANPILLYKLGVIKSVDEWEEKKNNWERDLRKLVPKSRKKFLSGGWRYRVIGKGTQIKNELLGDKKWQVEDGIKIGEWLDSLHYGVAELRDADHEYLKLLDKAKTYMGDPVLGELVNKYISLLYTYYSVLLDINYSRNWVKNRFDNIVHSALVGSEISPHMIEGALAEVIAEINQRLIEIENREVRSTRKTIEVTPIADGDDFYLEVKNNGDIAEFEAQIQIMEDKTGYKKGQLYIGYWLFADNPRSEIKSGHRDRLKIARLNVSLPIQSMHLDLFYYDPEYRNMMSFSSTSWMPTQDGTIIKPGYTLRVSISAKPSLIEGVFVQDYRLDLSNGLTKLKTGPT